MDRYLESHRCLERHQTDSKADAHRYLERHQSDSKADTHHYLLCLERHRSYSKTRHLESNRCLERHKSDSKADAHRYLDTHTWRPTGTLSICDCS